MERKRQKNNQLIFPDYKSIAPILRRGGIGVLKTDTIYGLVGSALNSEAVEKIYKVTNREKTKPLIVLISSIADLEKFDINPDTFTRGKLNELWPGKISVILKCKSEKFSYLHRGKSTVAFRCPDKKELVALIRNAGPLVAPSANAAEKKPAVNIGEARTYFEGKVDFYVDEGVAELEPSTLIRLITGRIEILRQGAASIDE